MRIHSRLCAFLIALPLVAAVGPRPARAAIELIPFDDDQNINRTFGGGYEDLPVRPNLDWREAVRWAYTMPKVKLAIQTFAERGYVATAAHDTAMSLIDAAATAVILSFRKPGLTLPQYNYGQPMIMIVTRLDREGVPATVVSAGLLILDPVKETVFTADSLPQYANTDASFDVVSDGGGGGGGEGDPGSKRWSIRTWWTLPDVKPRFNRWAKCVGVGSFGCLRAFFTVTRTPTVIVIAMAEPELVGLYFAACETLVATACMIDFYAN